MNGRLRWVLGALGGLTVVMVAATPAAADPVRDSQWQLGFLNVTEAQKLSQGEGVVVGVPDTGVDANHPDLAGSVLRGAGLTPQGGDGRQDTDGHGTAMAGLIAAHGRALGIAPKALILPVRVQDSVIGATTDNGVVWAVDHGAQVLCLAYNAEDSPEARAAIQHAVDRDVVIIGAVGNTDRPRLGPDPVEYPGVVGAAGVDMNGNHAAISVTSTFATLSAPAVDVGSTDTLSSPGRTGYRVGSGTSDATAIIAGAAALVRARFPRLSAADVVHRLIVTADDKGPPGRDDEYGYGVINLVRALTADVPTLTGSPSAEPSQPPTQPDSSRGIGVAFVIGALVVIALVGGGLIAVGVLRMRAR